VACNFYFKENIEVISYYLLPVFSLQFCHTIAETQCWQDWLLFADIFFFLMKSGCIDFLDFVDKLASRVANGDQQILRSNHVTWLLAQIIRIEIVMNTLSSDPRKVIFSCMMIFIHFFFSFSSLLY
jgi:hypothetical protein